MNPQELSAYFASLLRSAPEVIASFFMGALFAIMLALTVRRWAHPGRDSHVELVLKDAEIARRDAEIARKDAQIARLDAALANQRETLSDQEKLVAISRQPNAASASTSPNERNLLSQYVAAESRCALMEAENRQLMQDKQSYEVVASNLRTELAQAVDELAHWAKWSRLLDEENARLAEGQGITLERAKRCDILDR